MEAMVFAAGRGSRLEPLTHELPKPAVPVGHRPLAAYALDALARLGDVRAIRVNAHHLGERLPAALEAHAPPGVALRFVHEPVLLGTGGGLRNAFAGAPPRDAVVVMNGDVQFAPDLARAVEVHRRTGAIATMVLVPQPGGAVELDAEGQVRRILGVGRGGASAPLDRTGRGRASAPLTHMFTGAHVLDPRAFRDLPESGCIIRTAYFAWLERGETIAGVVDPGPFADLGTLEAYLDANVALAEGHPRVPPALALPAVHPGAHVGQGARIASSVVGEGARVADGVRLTRCVLWPGAEARHDAEDTIFTKAGEVRVSRRP